MYTTGINIQVLSMIAAPAAATTQAPTTAAQPTTTEAATTVAPDVTTAEDTRGILVSCH